MRIIAGKYKGLRFPPFQSNEIRPTTDKSKEAIFTYLENNYNIEGCSCLDYFAGSGTVSVEFLSRGAKSLVSLDRGKESIHYLLSLKKQLQDTSNWEILQQDVQKFSLKQDLTSYDIIFADPPYNMSSIHSFVSFIANNMSNTACFIIEHKTEIRFASPYLKETKNYGKSAFSIFNKES
jgi:16S rRNA (guanine(966)-N(2))-methyltransferase RsmD